MDAPRAALPWPARDAGQGDGAGHLAVAPRAQGVVARRRDPVVRGLCRRRDAQGGARPAEALVPRAGLARVRGQHPRPDPRLHRGL